MRWSHPTGTAPRTPGRAIAHRGASCEVRYGMFATEVNVCYVTFVLTFSEVTSRDPSTAPWRGPCRNPAARGRETERPVPPRASLVASLVLACSPCGSSRVPVVPARRERAASPSRRLPTPPHAALCELRRCTHDPLCVRGSRGLVGVAPGPRWHHLIAPREMSHGTAVHATDTRPKTTEATDLTVAPHAPPHTPVAAP